MNQNTLVDEFSDNGVICIKDALTMTSLNQLCEGVDNVINNPDNLCAICDIPSETGIFFNGFFQSLAEKNIKDFIHNSPVKDFAKTFLRTTNLNFFYDQLLAKSPRTSQRTPWHTDNDYFPFKGDQILTVWIPLDPITSNTGAMTFIRGSHKKNIDYYIDQCPVKKSLDQNKGMYVLPDFEKYPDKFEFISYDMDPGDILIFHINIIHCANSNLSQHQWRRALATRWLGDDVIVNEDKPHILQKKEIKEFIEKMGMSWKSKLDPIFFPDLG